MTEVHQAAAVGFEANAASYELARPGYPTEAVRFLVDRLGLDDGAVVVDVGAGTGKLTRLLTACGATAVAVEPVAAMRAELVQSAPEAFAIAATAAHLPLEGAVARGVVCAQAFHWFATPETLEEFSRVIVPGGTLALIWNRRDMTVDWVRRFTALLQPYEGARPDHNRGGWRAVFDRSDYFAPLETTVFANDQPLTPDLLAARAESMSFVGALDRETKMRLLEQVRGLGSQVGDTFTLPYRTEVHLAAARAQTRRG